MEKPVSQEKPDPEETGEHLVQQVPQGHLTSGAVPAVLRNTPVTLGWILQSFVPALRGPMYLILVSL